MKTISGESSKNVKDLSTLITELDEYLGNNTDNWLQLSYKYILSYIECMNIINKVDMITTNTTLDGFLGLYVYRMIMEDLDSTVQCLINNVSTANAEFISDNAISEDIRKAIDNDITVIDDVIYYKTSKTAIYSEIEDPQIPSDEELEEYEYFSFKQFYELLMIDPNDETAKEMFLFLLERLSIDKGMLCSEEDIIEIYPLIFEQYLKSYYEFSEPVTKKIIQCAKHFRVDPSKKLCHEDWVQLFKSDFDVIKFFRQPKQRTLYEKNANELYSLEELEFLSCTMAPDFLYDLYSEDNLFFFDNDSIGDETDFFKLLYVLDSYDRDMLMNWIHRCNFVKAMMDETGNKLKIYEDFINRPISYRNDEVYMSLIVNNEERKIDLLNAGKRGKTVIYKYDDIKLTPQHILEKENIIEQQQEKKAELYAKEIFEKGKAEVYWKKLIEKGFLTEDRQPADGLTKNDKAYIAMQFNEKLRPGKSKKWQYFQTLWGISGFRTADCNKGAFPRNAKAIDEAFM